MNKETEMYLIKRLEELTRDLAYSYADNEKLVDKIGSLKSNEQATKKALAFDVVSKIASIIKNNTAHGTEYQLVFKVPSIEINEAMAELFEEAING